MVATAKTPQPGATKRGTKAARFRPDIGSYVGLTHELCSLADTIGARLESERGGVFKRPHVTALALKALAREMGVEG